MESGAHAGHGYIGAHANMLACMHDIFWHAWVQMLAKWGPIREIKVSMESWEHAWTLWVHKVTQAYKLAYMHAMFLCTQAYISAKLGQIREIKVSIE